MRHALKFLFLFHISIQTFGQSNTKLLIPFDTDKSTVTSEHKLSIDSFLRTRTNSFHILITGNTDNKGSEEYNQQLSLKRAVAVNNYLKGKGISGEMISLEYFGETKPLVENTTEVNKALNRRVEIEIKNEEIISAGLGGGNNNPPPPASREIITSRLNNGVILTYPKGSLPSPLQNAVAQGTGVELIENTIQMQANNMVAMTTTGGLLSSLSIFKFDTTLARGQARPPCIADTLVKVQIPINNPISCPITKLKFFNSVVQDGYTKWKSDETKLYPEIINGRQYITVWLNQFCESYNFDYDLEPDCFRNLQMQIVINKLNVTKIQAIIDKVNTIYIPARLNSETYQLVFNDMRIPNLFLNLALVDNSGKKYSFNRVPIEAIKFDKKLNVYRIKYKNLKKLKKLYGVS